MARKNLFISLGEMQLFYPFQDNDDLFITIKPTLDQVERKYILTEIDSTTWESLMTQMGETDTPTYTNEIWRGLAERLQLAAANLAALYYLDKGNVTYSGAGLLVPKTSSAVPASEFRTQQLRKSLFRDVQDALDQVIEYLEGNTAIFTNWASSEMRSDLNGQIIRTAKEFNDAYSISESRYIFRKLLPSQKYVIDTQVKAVLGKEFLEAYITDLTSGLNDDHLEINKQLHRAIAYLTIGHAVPRLQQQFGPEGIALFDSEFQQSFSRRQDGDLQRIRFMSDDAISKGESDLADLKHFLDKNASSIKYPEYFNSEKYDDPEIDLTDANDYEDNERTHHTL